MWWDPYGFHQTPNMEETQQNTGCWCPEESHRIYGGALTSPLYPFKNRGSGSFSRNWKGRTNRQPTEHGEPVEESGPPGRFWCCIQPGQAANLCIRTGYRTFEDPVESSRRPVAPVELEAIIALVFSSLTGASFIYPLRVFCPRASSFTTNLTLWHWNKDGRSNLLIFETSESISLILSLN